MRVLVCGGRDFADATLMEAVLNRIHGARPISLLIHGAASGADRLAGQWAGFRGIEVSPNAANWKAYGNAAGPLRNQYMLAALKPDLVVAFPGGKGTADMVRRALIASVEVHTVAARRRA